MKRSRSSDVVMQAAAAVHVAFVFPHQLFYTPANPAVEQLVTLSKKCAISGTCFTGRVILVEESLFFTQFRFHKTKLALHRASMKLYEMHLKEKFADVPSLSVEYIEATSPEHDVRALVPAILSDATVSKADISFHCADVADDWLRRRLIRVVDQHVSQRSRCRTSLQWHPTPNFVTPLSEGLKFFESRTGTRKYFMAPFYEWQRKRMGVLMKSAEAPLGGKWSFDTENRKKFPKGMQLPLLPSSAATFPAKSASLAMTEALEYIKKNFSHHYGSVELLSMFDDGAEKKKATTEAELKPSRPSKSLPYAVEPYGAAEALKHFVAHRLGSFGPYQDAMLRNEVFLGHSAVSFMINVGLLSPDEVTKAVESAHGHSATLTPIASAEGFIRQVIGWREYVRILYETAGRKQRIANSWNFTRRMPEIFWEAATGIQPVDDVIRRVLRTGYAHHIERLMVLGNFFLLCECHPDDVYQWFMELFVDAFDWVMVPNVYGMSQFSDGGLMCTKPYISGSNYLSKMSDWNVKEKMSFPPPRSGDSAEVIRIRNELSQRYTWAQVWDSLFWTFLDRHRAVILKCHRLGMLVGTYDKFDTKKRSDMVSLARLYMSYIDAASRKQK